MQDVKHGIDAGAAIGALGALLNWMPKVAALLSVIWYVIRIVEWVRTKREGRSG